MLLPRGSLRSDLGEARRDHAERADAALERVLRGGERRLGRHAEHGQIDVALDLAQAGNRRHAGDFLAAAVDRVGAAGKARVDHVAKELASDRASACRGADHGQADGREEMPQRGGHADMVSCVAAGERLPGRLDHHRRLDHAVDSPPRDGEARIGDHREHPLVRLKDLEDQSLDDRPRTRAGPTARAAAFRRRAAAAGRPQKGGFGRLRIAQAHVARERHDVFASVLHERRDQRPAAVPIRVEVTLDQMRRRAHGAVKAHLAAGGREILEERQQGGRICSQGRPQTQSLPVAEDDVEHDRRAGGHSGTVRRSRPRRSEQPARSIRGGDATAPRLRLRG